MYTSVYSAQSVPVCTVHCVYQCVILKQFVILTLEYSVNLIYTVCDRTCELRRSPKDAALATFCGGRLLYLDLLIFLRQYSEIGTQCQPFRVYFNRPYTEIIYLSSLLPLSVYFTECSKLDHCQRVMAKS